MFIKTEAIQVRVTLDPEFEPAGGMGIWARHINGGGSWRPTVELSDDVVTVGVSSMLQMAYLLRTTPWEECKQVLEVARAGSCKSLRIALGRLKR